MASKTKEWTGKDTDRFLDMVLAGRTVTQVAYYFSREPEEIKAIYREIFYVTDYEPSSPRIARSGKPMLALETKLIAKWKSLKKPMAALARILQRDLDELGHDLKGEVQIGRMREVAPGTDLLLAHHYLIHQSKIRLVSDQAFESMKKEEIEFGGGADLLRMFETFTKVGDYPEHIRALAMYLLYKHMEMTGKWQDSKIPYSWRK